MSDFNNVSLGEGTVWGGIGHFDHCEPVFGKQLDAFGVELVFQGQAFLPDGVDSVRLLDGKAPLADDGARIFTIVDKVHCAPAHLAAVSKRVAVSRQPRETRAGSPDGCS